LMSMSIPARGVIRHMWVGQSGRQKNPLKAFGE
jgi:hypothetical protein